jgi:hypothetical protein
MHIGACAKVGCGMVTCGAIVCGEITYASVIDCGTNIQLPNFIFNFIDRSGLRMYLRQFTTPLFI